MKKNKTQGKSHINVAAIAKLRDQLVAFTDEFDTSDPEQTEVMLDTRISNLLLEGLIEEKVSGWYIEDVLTTILQGHTTDELVENALTMRTLISSYGGQPTTEDMEEAYEILRGIIDRLNKIKGVGEPHGQAKIKSD